jgi:hypothetical protein
VPLKSVSSIILAINTQKQAEIWIRSKNINEKKKSLSNPKPIFKKRPKNFNILLFSLIIFNILSNLVNLISLKSLPTLVTLKIFLKFYSIITSKGIIASISIINQL